jgi:hypothetical protein
MYVGGWVDGHWSTVVEYESKGREIKEEYLFKMEKWGNRHEGLIVHSMNFKDEAK